jgi:hypothetical protein
MIIMPYTIVNDQEDTCSFVKIATAEYLSSQFNPGDPPPAPEAEMAREQKIFDSALRATRDRFLDGQVLDQIAHLERFRDFLKMCAWPPADLETRRGAISELERDWSAKLADTWLHAALKAAFDDDRVRARHLIGKAKPRVSRAVSLGIGERFSNIASRKIQVVEFTFGVKDVDEKLVKPIDRRARPRDLAKSERRESNRFSEPPLMAYFDGEVISTEDYSMSGLGLTGYRGPLVVGDRTTMSFGRSKNDLVTVEVEIGRRDPEAGLTGVHFINAKPEVYSYISGLIRSQRSR